jgi:peptidoglycan hydrolase-like protein with peptidoglycan-binding domain
MRVSAAILAVILGSSAALAQSDPRANPAPPPEAAPAPAPAPTAKAEPAAKPEPKSKSALKKHAAKPKPDPEKTAGAEKKDEPAPAKPKAKPAAANSATSGSAAAGNPSAKPSGLQDTYAAIPPADRVAIQNDLTWGGDYSGPIDGEYSERLVQAVRAYQTRHKNPVTGVMSPEERKALFAAVEPRKQEVGWRLAEDPVTGARVGLPGKLATKVTPGPNGTRWASEQGQLQVETFRIDTGATLEAVFEQQKKMPRRRIEGSS